MKRTDVAELVIYMTQLQPAQKVDEYTDVAWFDVLGDVEATFEQARQATARVAKRERWIFPSAIHEELKTILRSATPDPPAPAIEQMKTWQAVEDRPERIARGMAKVRAALAEARKNAAVDRPEPTEEDLKRERLLQAAADHRAGRRISTRQPLTDAARVDPAALVAQFQQLPERTAE